MSTSDSTGGGGGNIPPWDDLILLGKLTRTQGHRGAIRLLPEFAPLDLFEGLKSDELILKLPPPISPAAASGAPAKSPPRPSARQVVHVSEHFFHQRYVILSFKEVPDMNAAERLQGAMAYVRPEHVWDLEEGEFFTHEVLGFEVLDEASGRKLGEVTTVETGAAHDFLMVRRAEGKGEFPVPLVKVIVRQVDKANRRILVTLPEGLEEL